MELPAVPGALPFAGASPLAAAVAGGVMLRKFRYSVKGRLDVRDSYFRSVTPVNNTRANAAKNRMNAPMAKPGDFDRRHVATAAISQYLRKKAGSRSALFMGIFPWCLRYCLLAVLMVVMEPLHGKLCRF